MYLQYGAVKLKVLDLTRFERETVWSDDGADLLYVRNTIGVTAVYAPGGNPVLTSLARKSLITQDTVAGQDATADILEKDHRPLAPPLEQPHLESDLTAAQLAALPMDKRATGPETDVELRLLLTLPRQTLILWAYSRETGEPFKWLESPRPGFETDAANGPKPLSVDVVSASGEPNSIAVHFQVQTDMSPCPAGGDQLVLSHRWEMTHTHDEDQYLTRIIRGRIVFNGAVYRHAKINPDFVRAQFLHPVPIGYVRTVPRVCASSDGLTIEYQIHDTDPKITFDPGNSGATRVAIREKTTVKITGSMPGLN